MVKSQPGDQAAYAIRIDRCRRISPGINDKRRNSGISPRNDARQHVGRKSEMTSTASYAACSVLFCRLGGLLIRWAAYHVMPVHAQESTNLPLARASNLRSSSRRTRDTTRYPPLGIRQRCQWILGAGGAYICVVATPTVCNTSSSTFFLQCRPTRRLNSDSLRSRVSRSVEPVEKPIFTSIISVIRGARDSIEAA